MPVKTVETPGDRPAHASTPASTPAKSTMQVDERVASLIRRLAGFEGRRLSETLERMLAAYMRVEHPGLVLTYEYGDPRGDRK